MYELETHREQKEKYVVLNTALFLATHNKEEKKVIEEIAMFSHNLVNSQLKVKKFKIIQKRKLRKTST